MANIIGTSGNDNLLGTANADTFDGLTGYDTMSGGAGNDVYIVNSNGFREFEQDVVRERAGEGSDTIRTSVSYVLGFGVAAEENYIENLEMIAGAGDLSGLGNNLANRITGNEGSNILAGGGGVDTLSGGLGDDRYDVNIIATGAGKPAKLEDVIVENANAGADTIRLQGMIADLINPTTLTLATNLEHLDASRTGTTKLNIIGNSANNFIAGNEADNILDGGSGADALFGHLGNDTYVLDNVADTVTELAGQGTDTIKLNFTPVGTYILGADLEKLIIGGSGSINATGNALNNALTGNSGKNLLTGLDGDDTLSGGTGADTMIGGLGNDTYIVDNIGDVVTENPGEGTDTVQSSISYTLGITVENLVLTGTLAINGTGHDGGNRIEGNAANNRIDGGEGGDYLYGNAGNDTLLGGVDDDILYGQDGNDVLDGGIGYEELYGGAGNDVYIADSFGDLVYENAGEGTDTVRSSDNYTLSANVENLELIAGAGNLNGTGNTLANKLTGNEGNNVLDGLGGADTMIGGNGNDLYIVDNSLDVVTESSGAGIDTVESSVTFTLAANIENLTLLGLESINGTGNTLANTLTGNSRNNTLNGGAGIDTMIGGLGNDTYIVDSVGDVVTENSLGGNDTVQSLVSYTLGANIEILSLLGSAAINATGNSEGNSLNGNSGNNILDGGGGDDWLLGGKGNDTYVVDNADDVVFELTGEGIDTIKTSVSYVLGTALPAQYNFVENLILIAGTGNLDGTGNALANKITGNEGHNVLTGGSGVDSLIGGLGNDTYAVNLISSGTGSKMIVKLEDVITENANSGTDTLQLQGNIAGLPKAVTLTLAANLENLDASATGTTWLNLTGNSSSNVLTGNAADNILDGGIGPDTLIGGLGNDTYVIDLASDVIVEAGGTDTVKINFVPFGGHYTLGTDLENLSMGSAFNPVVHGNNQNNVITGNDSNNVLFGGSGNDTIYGGKGNDTLDGEAGNDHMYGGAGNDIYIADSYADWFYEFAGEGIDTVRSADNFSLIDGLTPQNYHVENLELVAGAGDIDGTGNPLANLITGNEGANILDGHEGKDTLIGGAGNDQFRFSTALNATTNVDRIADFSVVADSIDLDNDIFTMLGSAGALNANFFCVGTAAADGDDYLIYNSSTGQLFYDADGSNAGAKILFAQLDPGLGLTSADFNVVN